MTSFLDTIEASAKAATGRNPRDFPGKLIASHELLGLLTPDNILALVRVARAARFYASDPDALEAALDALPQ